VWGGGGGVGGWGEEGEVGSGLCETDGGAPLPHPGTKAQAPKQHTAAENDLERKGALVAEGEGAVVKIGVCVCVWGWGRQGGGATGSGRGGGGGGIEQLCRRGGQFCHDVILVLLHLRICSPLSCAVLCHAMYHRLGCVVSCA
jgi:hypothetical protein